MVRRYTRFYDEISLGVIFYFFYSLLNRSRIINTSFSTLYPLAPYKLNARKRLIFKRRPVYFVASFIRNIPLVNRFKNLVIRFVFLRSLTSVSLLQ